MMSVLQTSKMGESDAYRVIIDNSKAMLQIVASRTDESRGVIYDRNMYMFIVRAGQISVRLSVIITVNTRSGRVEWSTRRSTN